jgi:ppGpp synthetase/RelA/SpoT-type nucleotidyltranferase
MIWYDDLAAAVQEALRSLDWQSLLYARPAPEISSRAKTIDTLRDKLRRDHSTPLSSVQDVAGVRFEAEMTLEEQSIVAQAIARAFGHEDSSIQDMRSAPRHGYRAVHVWLRLPPGRVEVQIRTDIQGEWANTYEALADAFGRGIRYGGPPDPDIPEIRAFVAQVQKLSTHDVVSIERSRQWLANFKLQAGTADADVREAALDVLDAEDAAEFLEAVEVLSTSEAKFMEALRSITATLRGER